MAARPGYPERVELGGVGVWWSGAWDVDGDASTDVAAELQSLGYTALWSSGGFRPGLSTRFERLLEATTTMSVLSGIVSIWATPAEEITRAVADLDGRFPGRFHLGIGASHAPIVEIYTRPFSHMVDYLDALDAAGPEVGRTRRVLAALGPRMLRLAAERAAGAHPYFVPVAHTARAREVMGDGALLAPELTVVLERDPATARALSRSFTTAYLWLANYADNLRSLGFGDEDLADGGSDCLVDAVVAWGSPDDVAARVHEHVAAGADHVCLQVLAPLDSFPVEAYRRLAPVLTGV